MLNESLEMVLKPAYCSLMKNFVSSGWTLVYSESVKLFFLERITSRLLNL